MNNTNTRTRGWRIITPVAAAVIALALVAGCETTTNAQKGEILGGVLGGVVGSQVGDGTGQTVAIIVGTMAGAMIGRQIGQSMDDVDRMKTAQALNDNRSGQSTTWTNPDTGEQYTVTPTRTYEQSGSPCREFELDATVGGEPGQRVTGTACLQADGTWKVVS